MTDLAEAVRPAAAAPTSTRRYKGPLKEAGFIRRTFLVRAGEGDTIDDIRHPDYFAPIGAKLTRHDIITVLGAREEYELELCVERVHANAVFTSVRKNYSREGFSANTTVVDGKGDFYSEFRSGKSWCIVRAKDSHPVVEGESSEANAIARWRREQPRPVVD